MRRIPLTADSPKRRTSRARTLGLLAGVALTAAACGSKAATITTTQAPGGGGSTTSSAPSGGSTVVVKTATVGTLGTVLVNSAGFTLYHFTADHPPSIACTGACAATWPPLLVPSGSKVSGPSGLATIKRPDGTTQVAFKGLPLYTYSGDSKAGQANGQAFEGTWFVLTSSSGSGGATTTSAAPGGSTWG